MVLALLVPEGGGRSRPWRASRTGIDGFYRPKSSGSRPLFCLCENGILVGYRFRLIRDRNRRSFVALKGYPDDECPCEGSFPLAKGDQTFRRNATARVERISRGGEEERRSVQANAIPMATLIATLSRDAWSVLHPLARPARSRMSPTYSSRTADSQHRIPRMPSS